MLGEEYCNAISERVRRTEDDLARCGWGEFCSPREAEAAAAAAEAAAQDEASDCDPNYSGCLDPNASDYDCEGGSGDGPLYTGPVEIRGSDPHGLDADGDGIGCEPY